MSYKTFNPQNPWKEDTDSIELLANQHIFSDTGMVFNYTNTIMIKY